MQFGSSNTAVFFKMRVAGVLHIFQFETKQVQPAIFLAEWPSCLMYFMEIVNSFQEYPFPKDVLQIFSSMDLMETKNAT